MFGVSNTSRSTTFVPISTITWVLYQYICPTLYFINRQLCVLLPKSGNTNGPAYTLASTSASALRFAMQTHLGSRLRRISLDLTVYPVDSVLVWDSLQSQVFIFALVQSQSVALDILCKLSFLALVRIFSFNGSWRSQAAWDRYHPNEQAE